VHIVCPTCATKQARIEELKAALKKVESHHVFLNKFRGRDESDSMTLSIVRAVIDAEKEE
jgi:hypothetical protein